MIVLWMNCTWWIFWNLWDLLLARSNKIIWLNRWRYSNWMIILSICQCARIVMMLLLSLYLFRCWSRSLRSYSVTCSAVYLFLLGACTACIHMSRGMTASRMTNNSLISIWTRSTVLFWIFSCRLVCLAMISTFSILILVLLNYLTILIFYKVIITRRISSTI